MNLLGIDLGTRRTGVAFYDDRTEIILPLPTIEHKSDGELTMRLQHIVTSKKIDRVVLGLPLLPSGRAGSQAIHVQRFGELLKQIIPDIVYFDERYSTRPASKNADAEAAISILRTYLERELDKH